MGKKKKSGGGMSFVRRGIKKFASGLAAGLVAVGISHGAISTASDVATGAVSLDKVPQRLIERYTGFKPDTHEVDWTQTVTSVLIIGGSVAAALLIRWGAKHA